MEKRRRPSKPASRWAEIVGAWQQSGLSAKQFADEHDLSAQSLVKWRSQLRRKHVLAPGKNNVVFVPLQSNEASPLEHQSAHGSIEIALKSGDTIRVQGDVCSDVVSAVLSTLTR